MVLTVAFLMWRLSWPHVEAAGDPAFGINYSCNQAEYLLLEDPALGPAGYVSDDRAGRAEWCAATLGRLLDGTGAKYVRLSVEWSQVEPAEGVYDFRLVDALLAEAGRHGTSVLLTVGIKAQRHPEYYIPPWVLAKVQLHGVTTISDLPPLRDPALAMVRAVAAHVAASPAIDSWGADNEPFVPSARAEEWVIGRDFVDEEVRILHELDPLHRPVVVNHAQHFVFDRRWRDALADSDILGTSIYPYRNYDLPGLHLVVPIVEIGPFGPNYAAQARAAHKKGGQFWITEMQGEPWADHDIRLVTPDHPLPDVTPGHFRDDIDYARRTGADRVYLWGAEWWLFMREKYGDETWMALGRAALGGEIR